MAHPLMCWDIIQEGQIRRQEFENDIRAINEIRTNNKWDFIYPRTLDNCIIWENKTIIITDPSLKIELATKNMFEMNGYKPEEVVGQTPGIFQGEATTDKEKKLIRDAVRKRHSFESIITNYRKNGTLYRCHIEGYPVFNVEGKLVNFIAFEKTYYE